MTTFEVVLFTVGAQPQTDRVYSKSVLDDLVNAGKGETFYNVPQAFGPVNLERIGLKVTDVRWNDDETEVIGTAEFLPTPVGEKIFLGKVDIKPAVEATLEEDRNIVASAKLIGVVVMRPQFLV